MAKEPLLDGISRMSLFRKIVLEHPRLDDIRKKIDWLFKETASVVADNEAQLLAARGRPIKVDELWLLPIVGPSGAMKSTSFRKVLQEINANEAFPVTDVPVLALTLRQVKTPRGFLTEVLGKYGDAAKNVIPKSGPLDAEVVARAIYHIARAKKTVLLVIDEAHELLRHDGGKVGMIMATLIKSMLNEGVFSIVMLGTDEVLNLFHISPELRNRCVPDEKVTLKAFDIKNHKDRVYFFKFLKKLELEMVRVGVVDKALGWVDTLEDRAKIFDMCEGVLGVACRILRMSLELAFRDGRPTLEWTDIESAFRAFNRNQKRPGFDPFADGPRKETLGRLTAEANAKKKGCKIEEPA